MVFIGPSGCGKSTILRLISGLIPVSGGDISIAGEVVTHVPASHRGVAFVFQSYALYPHMTVARNIGFSLETAKLSRALLKQRVNSVAEMLKIDHLLDRKPKALSGGQRQRVAIGRAIIRQPDVFLFDEPLSNLDSDLRAEMRYELARLHGTLGTTMIYVTHDQTEAMTLADRIVVLNAGRIEQTGTPDEIYSRPANRFVAGFMGSPRMNFAPFDLHTSLARSVMENGYGADLLFTEIGIRAENLHLVPAKEGILTGVLERVENLGHEILAYIRITDEVLWVMRTKQSLLTCMLGETTGLSWEDVSMMAFTADGKCHVAGNDTSLEARA